MFHVLFLVFFLSNFAPARSVCTDKALNYLTLGIESWNSTVQQLTSTDFVTILIGTKCEHPPKRMVTREEGEAEAQKLGIEMEFIETSAWSVIKIEYAFLLLIR